MTGGVVERHHPGGWDSFPQIEVDGARRESSYGRPLARSATLTDPGPGDPGPGDAARGSALDRLPEPFAVALRMRDAGLTSELIGLELDVDPEAVDQLLVLGEAKLARLLRQGEIGRKTGPSD